MAAVSRTGQGHFSNELTTFHDSSGLYFWHRHLFQCDSLMFAVVVLQLDPYCGDNITSYRLCKAVRLWFTKGMDTFV